MDSRNVGAQSLPHPRLQTNQGQHALWPQNAFFLGGGGYHVVPFQLLFAVLPQMSTCQDSNINYILTPARQYITVTTWIISALFQWCARLKVSIHGIVEDKTLGLLRLNMSLWRQFVMMVMMALGDLRVGRSGPPRIQAFFPNFPNLQEFSVLVVLCCLLLIRPGVRYGFIAKIRVPDIWPTASANHFSVEFGSILTSLNAHEQAWPGKCFRAISSRYHDWD